MWIFPYCVAIKKLKLFKLATVQFLKFRKNIKVYAKDFFVLLNTEFQEEKKTDAKFAILFIFNFAFTSMKNYIKI